MLSAKGERGELISVGLLGRPYIERQGRLVFSEAIQQVVAMINHVSKDAAVPIDELDLIIPHQANSRITDAIADQIKPARARVVNMIREAGNTSSSSIPLTLTQISLDLDRVKRIGLCAFGGGFTSGACIWEHG